jgi:hypothetical protein
LWKIAVTSSQCSEGKFQNSLGLVQHFFWTWQSSLFLDLFLPRFWVKLRICVDKYVEQVWQIWLSWPHFCFNIRTWQIWLSWSHFCLNLRTWKIWLSWPHFLVNLRTWQIWHFCHSFQLTKNMTNLAFFATVSS